MTSEGDWQRIVATGRHMWDIAAILRIFLAIRVSEMSPTDQDDNAHSLDAAVEARRGVQMLLAGARAGVQAGATRTVRKRRS